MVFSVIIPTKNRPAMLIEAIKSVQDQTFTDWEIIIVDDGSTQETKEAVTPLLSSKIRYIRNEQSLGPGGSRNAGIRSAHPDSTLISLLDDDDIYFPDFLKKTYECLYHSTDDIGFSWTGIENLYVETNTCDRFFWDPPFRNKEEAFNGFLQKRLIGTGYGITFKRNVFDKVGYFDESLRAVEDTDFFLRVLKSFFYIKIPDVLVRVLRQNDNHVNADTLERAEALQKIFNKHQESFARNAVAWFNFKAKISSIYYRLGEKKRGREVLVRALGERFSIRILMLWIRLEISSK